jgi:hypothetical protein
MTSVRANAEGKKLECPNQNTEKEGFPLWKRGNKGDF